MNDFSLISCGACRDLVCSMKFKEKMSLKFLRNAFGAVYLKPCFLLVIINTLNKHPVNFHRYEILGYYRKRIVLPFCS